MFGKHESLIIKEITLLVHPSLIITIDNELRDNLVSKQTHGKHYRDVLQLSIGFFFIFFAFNSSQVY